MNWTRSIDPVWLRVGNHFWGCSLDMCKVAGWHEKRIWLHEEYIGRGITERPRVGDGWGPRDYQCKALSLKAVSPASQRCPYLCRTQLPRCRSPPPHYRPSVIPHRLTEPILWLHVLLPMITAVTSWFSSQPSLISDTLRFITDPSLDRNSRTCSRGIPSNHDIGTRARQHHKYPTTPYWPHNEKAPRTS